MEMSSAIRSWSSPDSKVVYDAVGGRDAVRVMNVTDGRSIGRALPQLLRWNQRARETEHRLRFARRQLPLRGRYRRPHDHRLPTYARQRARVRRLEPSIRAGRAPGRLPSALTVHTCTSAWSTLWPDMARSTLPRAIRAAVRSCPPASATNGGPSNTDRLIAMAPDNLNLYALDWSAQRTIRVYSRAPESGALTLIQSLQAALAASRSRWGLGHRDLTRRQTRLPDE